MDTKSLPQSGVIYIFEKANGKRVSIPVEQTPDDITTLPTIKPPVEEPKVTKEEVVKKYDPRDELSSIAFTPIPEKPKFDPFGFPMGKPGANPFGAPGGFGKPRTNPFGKPPFPKPMGGFPAQPFRKPFPSQPGGAKTALQPQLDPKPVPAAPAIFRSFQEPIAIQTKPKAAPQTSGATPVNAVSQTRPHQAPDARDVAVNSEQLIVNSKAVNSKAVNSEQLTENKNAESVHRSPLTINQEPVLELPTPHALNHVSVPDAPEIPKPQTLDHGPKTADVQPSPVVLPFASHSAMQPSSHQSSQQPDTRERSASTSDIERPFTPKKSGKSGGGWGFGGGRMGMALIALSVGGLLAPQLPKLKLEAAFKAKEVKEAVATAVNPPTPFPQSSAAIFDPLIKADGTVITPVNTEFALIVPKIGINAPVVANVNPADPVDYKSALKDGVAHSVTSFTPDKIGTTYLFSHSTNYEWFIDDLNAIFYLLKELKEDDLIVVIYKGVRYTYKLTGSKVVKPSQISYLSPRKDGKKLILQTCWPPGSIKERLLVFADLIDEQPYQAHLLAPRSLGEVGAAISPTPTK